MKRITDVSCLLSVERVEQIWVTRENGITRPGRADHVRIPQQHVHAFLESHQISIVTGPMADFSGPVHVDVLQSLTCATLNGRGTTASLVSKPLAPEKLT